MRLLARVVFRLIVCGGVWPSLIIIGSLRYQGENNCGGPTTGNSAQGTGYGCALPAMVASWRALFSAEAGTTDPLAPFGIATLAAGGSEGAGVCSRILMGA